MRTQSPSLRKQGQATSSSPVSPASLCSLTLGWRQDSGLSCSVLDTLTILFLGTSCSINTRTHRQAKNLPAAVPLEKPKTDSISPRRGGCSRVSPKLEFRNETGGGGRAPAQVPPPLTPVLSQTSAYLHTESLSILGNSQGPEPGTPEVHQVQLPGYFFGPGKDPSRVCRVQNWDLSVYLTRTTLVPQCCLLFLLLLSS